MDSQINMISAENDTLALNVLKSTAFRESAVSPSDELIELDNVAASNARDASDLARWGKRQQLKRNFGLVSIVSLTCTLMITWEGALSLVSLGLTNGGSAGLIYAFVYTWIGNFLQALVMAELASMMPLAGGQYNWVSVLAPSWCSKFLSYLTGWITFLSWQAVLSSACYLAATMIQALLILSQPGYTYETWHGTLLFYAILALSVFVNTTLVKYLPHIESFIFVIHIVGFFAVLLPLIYLTPEKASAKQVFTVFNNGGGWPSTTLSWFVGTNPTMLAFIGLDAATHMAEEIHNASRVIPRSMLWSVAINGTLGLSITITILFCLGDLHSVLNTATHYPFVQVFYNSTQSVGGAVAMASVVIAAMGFCTIGCLATAVRMTWAFSRERALPFSKYLSRIEPRTCLPLYCIALSAVINILLALTNIATETAFNALVSLTLAGFFTSYSIAAAVLLYRRVVGDDPNNPLGQLLYGPFHLGRFEIPIIILSLIYSTIGFIFSFWPPHVNPDADSMNWSILVFGGVVVFSLIFWVFHGRKVYRGPIMELRR